MIAVNSEKQLIKTAANHRAVFLFNALTHFWPVNNFIANILSKAFISSFADFHAPLKNSRIDE